MSSWNNGKNKRKVFTRALGFHHNVVPPKGPYEDRRAAKYRKQAIEEELEEDED